MRVAEATAFGSPDVLRPAERPDPEPAAGEVLVRIGAANVNPTDLAARSGKARRRAPGLAPPFVPGWDLAGEVVGLGGRVEDFAVGDRVVGMIPWIAIEGRVGAYAELAAVEPEWIAHYPGDADDAVAATLPLNALTARQALDLIALPRGAILLITGASGAVGAFATQLAVRDGLHVLALASDGDEEWVAGLGPQVVVPRGTDLAQLEPVNAVLDAVPIGPPATEPVRDGGVAFFTRSPGEFDRAAKLRVEAPLVRTDPAALRELAAEFAAGRLQTRVAEVLDLGEAARAHRLVEEGGLRGKVVLRP
jgi:NADPH2:quinone reductase